MKKVGELHNIPIVEGDPNLLTNRQLLHRGGVLSKRNVAGDIKDLGGSSEGGNNSGSQYHEIKPNGWYWKTTEAFKVLNMEIFIMMSSVYEIITEKEVCDFALAYFRCGELQVGNEGNNYLAPITYIQEAFPKAPSSAPSNVVLTSIKDVFIAQGMPEDSFLSTMESLGLVLVTEEEYMAAKNSI